MFSMQIDKLSCANTKVFTSSRIQCKGNFEFSDAMGEDL